MHLLAVNMATAAPLAAMWFARRGRLRGDVLASWVGGQLIRQSIIALAMGLVLGLAAGAILWLADGERLEAALRSLPYARLRDGVWELAFYFVCLAAYLPLARPAQNSRGAGTAARTAQWILVLAAVSNLAYHFPFLFSVLARLRNEAASSSIEAVSVRELLGYWKQPEYVAEFVHFLLASGATAGVGVMWLSLRLAKLNVTESEQGRIATCGARIAAVPSILQLAVGLYLLLALPERLQGALLGESLLATALFGISIVAALALMHRLVGVALGHSSRTSILQSVALLVATVLLMTSSLHAARSAAVTVMYRSGAHEP
jgi:hypothetical protein